MLTREVCVRMLPLSQNSFEIFLSRAHTRLDIHHTDKCGVSHEAFFALNHPMEAVVRSLEIGIFARDKTPKCFNCDEKSARWQIASEDDGAAYPLALSGYILC